MHKLRVPAFASTRACPSRSLQVAARDVEFGATPLHWAAAVGDEEVVRLLLHKGADVKVGIIAAQTWSCCIYY